MLSNEFKNYSLIIDEMVTFNELLNHVSLMYHITIYGRKSACIQYTPLMCAYIFIHFSG